MVARFVVALCLMSSAAAGDTIRIWKVGSPHKGDVPETAVPLRVQQELARRGFGISIEAFAAQGFAAKFFDAVARNEAPDLLVFDNFGVIEGITTQLGKFDGIGRDPTFRKHLIKVTDAFDELLPVQRGWTYLFDLSANYQAARTLALKEPDCQNGSSGAALGADLARIVRTVATSYLQGDAITLQTYADSDRIPPVGSKKEPARVGSVRPCGVWGNDKLVFVHVNASYEAETTIGHTSVLLALRKPASQWQLLVAARDPISNGAFVKELPSLSALLAHDGQTHTLPAPAMLLAPATGNAPVPRRGERFGNFTWRSSPSDDVVAEIVEFAYEDDARLVFSRPSSPGSRREISAGALWTTRGEWTWRIWSINGAGEIAFSEGRIFVH